ncbi:DUF2460 domain-containing protein [Pacificimonas sp. WHA3]|uniref:DUF2460 domain-containing protein n=1 Tax=Pacificimonas pallii TaxID=2827236 RepID=A0ABS6SAA6_9SPHN|nr:DUF2460 domain-containing protein [Pacificimonas pallii]MBV7255201.1 DUF2460 domain-containing protein [Pacificimonas pallii]
MGHYLAGPGDQVRTDWMARFDAAHWTLNFPRPMMASVTTTAADSLRVDLAYYKRDDLCGLIWDSVDQVDHPLLRYETRRDYRGMLLSFGWRSVGDVKPLDVPNGAVLTIEGRDAEGAAQVWYVRLWNYASGSVTDAQIVLDFDDMRSGFEPGGDKVFAGDIDRMFISLTPEGFDGSDAPLTVPEEATVWLEGIRCEGSGSKIRIGDACIPPHKLRIATGYDDDYHLTPERLLRNVQALGYRKWLTLYVGMSHFMRLEPRAGGAGFKVVTAGDPLVGPCRIWMEDLAARAAADDVTIIFSLSYELFDAYAPEEWKQRAHDGSPALTGWAPPSTLLSPVNGDAMAWLQSVAAAFAGISQIAGRESWFQVGEPWWWTGFGDRQVPCFYDDAAVAAYTAETGSPEPVRLTNLPGTLTAAQANYVAWLGGKLGQSVLSVMDAVKAAVPGTKTAMLFYAPQVLREDAPWLKMANMPAEFAAPAFDVLQLEDYDFVLAEDRGASRRAVAAIEAELGYPAAAQDYFSGFVLTAEARGRWPVIAEAAERALARDVRETFVWALPQVRRDGFTYFTMDGETNVDAFHDVAFPIALGEGASGGPEFLTQVAETISGHEQRSIVWAQGRLRYDAGPGIRSEADLSALVRFYRARRGQAHGFRLRDLLDHSSGDDGGLDARDQLLGIGDGVRTDFPLLKRYGDGEDAELRRITRPEAGTARVAVDGSEVFGWTLEAGGVVRFDNAPTGAVSAGYLFDVPVRFAEDRLEISLNAWRAGEVPSVPMVEVREA